MVTERKNDSWENEWLENYVGECAPELVLLIVIWALCLRLATLTFQKGEERNG